MGNINDIIRLKKLGTVPVPFGVLRELYRDFASPAKKIAELCSQGLLFRVKRGLYIVSEKIVGEKPAGELIANHLYGPSYVSMETALQYYGMIPEGVYSFESATTKPAKQYDTPYGAFRYHRCKLDYYRIGINMGHTKDGSAYLLASPEKSLCDLLVNTRGLQIRSRISMLSYLVDFLRIDEESLAALKPALIHECAMAGPKKETLHYLEETIKWIKSSGI
jgi:hypothetical protein